MEKAFVYGMSVEGENFTDRVKETKRLKLDLENGINVILVSPRRIGKSSIVRKVMKEMADTKIKMVFMSSRCLWVSHPRTTSQRKSCSCRR